MRPEYLVYILLFILIGWMFITFFLVWNWYDADDRLAIVRIGSRDETIRAIKRGHNRCRVVLYLGIAASLAFSVVPFLMRDFYTVLAYPAVVIAVNITILVVLHFKAQSDINEINDFIAANEEQVRLNAEELDRDREQWRKQAPNRNAIAKAHIQETMGDQYETWFEDDILVEHNVLANLEEGLLYAQGVVIPFSQIMELRKGRKSLKLITNNSRYPFVKIDFGKLPIDPETGEMYNDELALLIKRQMS
ncbi:MAG: hypothetical protein IJS82_05205 [Paludibacteraceae bacterium]|nr:hypothetical protein [Paludibacteraceae bacterium]